MSDGKFRFLAGAFRRKSQGHITVPILTLAFPSKITRPNSRTFTHNTLRIGSLHDLLLELAEHYRWSLEAWAIFSNHYHVIAQSPENPSSLVKFISHVHAASSRKLNALHQTPGRKVWYQYWDSRITFQNSYLARLKYVMENPVRHKVVISANQYRWCSASWFEKNTTKAHFETVKALKTDSVNVYDDF